MITDQVIKEIYQKFGSSKRTSDLNLDYFIEILSSAHNISIIEDELVINNLEELNPFRRFLIKAIQAILEFDKVVAIVFYDHIIFLDKQKNEIHVHFRNFEQEKKKWWRKLLFWKQ